MEKLIKLLRESFPLDYDYVENDWHICHWYTDETGEYNRYWNIDSEIISKKFWFIKWLIDNDKIDFDKTQIWFQLTLWYWKYDSLLMILSISDTPIEDLISYLK